MRHELVAAGRCEIGGILMGQQLSRGHFRIVDFSVDPERGGSGHFIRHPEYHREVLEAFFERTSSEFLRFNYLGEWHSHPSFPVFPSEKDVDAMKCLVEEEHGIDFAVLLIARTRWRFLLDYAAVLFQQGGYTSEVDFV